MQPPASSTQPEHSGTDVTAAAAATAAVRHHERSRHYRATATAQQHEGTQQNTVARSPHRKQHARSEHLRFCWCAGFANRSHFAALHFDSVFSRSRLRRMRICGVLCSLHCSSCLLALAARRSSLLFARRRMPPPSAAAGSGCPVDHGQYAAKPAGHPGSPAALPAAAVPWKTTPVDPQSLICNSAALAMPPQLPRMSGGTCPVDHSQFKTPAAAAAAAAAAHSGSGGVGVVGDHFPDATRGPNQKQPLSTAPVASTIPRGGVAPPGQPALAPDATWIFPSPQRFYNGPLQAQLKAAAAVPVCSNVH